MLGGWAVTPVWQPTGHGDFLAGVSRGAGAVESGIPTDSIQPGMRGPYASHWGQRRASGSWESGGSTLELRSAATQVQM